MADVLRIIRARLHALRSQEKPSVVVGFSSAVALFVHENVQARNIGLNVPRKSGIGVYWGPHGGPKFLEGPAREMADELAGVVREALARGVPLPQALLLAGYVLQREAMERVPVEHGALRASAFTRLEE